AAAAPADLNEALDLVLAEAGDRGPTRVSLSLSAASADDAGDVLIDDALAESGPSPGPEVAQDAVQEAVIEIETARAERPWPPLLLRAAGLLAERAGGRFEEPRGRDGGFDHLSLRFARPGPRRDGSASSDP
ncbi:MAG: hypothetical protein AAF909_12530, partial [Pseudomonadota bacterium]